MAKYYGPDDDLSDQTLELTEDTVFDRCKSTVNLAIVKTTQGVSINCADASTTLNGVALWAG